MNTTYMNSFVQASGINEPSVLETKLETKAIIKAPTISPTLVKESDYSDQQLLEILNSFGFELDRDSFHTLIKDSHSTDEIFESLLAKSGIDVSSSNFDADWLFFSMDALWRRWYPNCIAAQHIQTKIFAGEDLLNEAPLAAVNCWLKGFVLLFELLERTGWKTIAEYENRFDLMYSIPEWIFSLQHLLGEIGKSDKNCQELRILICKETLDKLPTSKSDPDYANYEFEIKEFRKVLAEAKKATMAKSLIKDLNNFNKGRKGYMNYRP